MKKIIVLIISVLCLAYVCASNKINVSTTEQLQVAISNAEPGDVISLLKGHYDAKISIEGMGTKEQPITIEAKVPGDVLIENMLLVKGNYITLKNLEFVKQGQLEVEGEGIRVTTCTWDDSECGKWFRVLAGSMHVEIDHNVFKNKVKSNTTMDKNCQLLQVLVRNQNESHHIHHNVFKDIAVGKTDNGFETIQLRTEFNKFKRGDANTNNLVEHNLFLRCNGESEVVSVKSNGNIIRNNTFRACSGGLVLRHGERSEISSNYFLADGEANSAGVRMAGNGHKVCHNYMQDLGQYTLAMMDGTPTNFYIHVDDIDVMFNSFINCDNNFVIGLNHPRFPEGTVPTNCRVVGNVFYSEKDNASESFFHFENDEKPTTWTVAHNVAQGKNTSDMAGVTSKAIELVVNEDKLFVPTANTFQIKASDLPCAPSSHDIFGQPYSNNPMTVGAIQYPIVKVINQPLTEDQL